ncbi:MAG: hypothetical protein KAR42_15070 [candidate division Zixibacteria bacterium]|nr:hypothetical protein [candidate division Zixibacteria bacterium]
MVVNLREKVEQDLGVTLEGAFSLLVVLIDPDGVTQSSKKDDRDTDLTGQVLYDTVVEDPATGGRVVINEPIVTLRRSSLIRVPEAGETWSVKIPLDPSTPEVLTTFILDPTKSPEGGRSIGFIRLYLKKAAQE